MMLDKSFGLCNAICELCGHSFLNIDDENGSDYCADCIV